MKRDILIFPKFENVKLIQDVRQKYDRLASILMPHITLVFPFDDDTSNVNLIFKVNEILASFCVFKVEFKGVSLSDDGYIFLNCTKGSEDIIKLHDEIYEKILPSHLNTKRKYIPHITLGNATSIDFEFDYTFSCTIDEIVIEEIGENEESIIIDKFKLNHK